MTGRDRMMVIVLAVAAVAAAGWFLVLAPMREEASNLSAQVDAQQQALDAARAEAVAGAQAKRAYARHYETVARLGAAVPEDDNVASLLFQVEQAADASSVDFRSLKVGQGSGTGAAPAPPAPASPTQTATATLPPGAIVGSAGFPTMPFSFTFTGSFFRLSDFVGRLEAFLVARNGRLAVHGRFMTLDGIGLKAAPEGFPKIEANVQATTYLLPAGQGLTDGATASGPADAAPASGSGAPSSDTASSGAAPRVAAATPVVR